MKHPQLTDASPTGASVDSDMAPSSKGTKAVSWLMGIAIIGLTIFYGPRLKAVLMKVDVIWVLAGLVCYSFNYGLRAWRWQLLTRGRVPWWPEGMHASCVHGFAAYMLPFRAGELTLPLVLRNVTGLKLTQGSRALIRARLLDVHTLGIWVIFIALGTDLALSHFIRFAWIGVGGIMVLAPVLIRCLASTGTRTRFALVRRLSGFVALEPLTVREWVASLMIWFAVAGVFFCAAQAIALAIDLRQVWLLITLQLPLQLVPVQGIANTGNHEGGWVAGLILLGFSADQAIEFALASHFVLLFYVLLLGPAGLMIGRLCRTRPVAS